MTHADPDDAVMDDEPEEETAQAGLGTKVGGPLGVVLGLGLAVATGVFMTEDGPPSSQETAGSVPAVIEEVAPTAVMENGMVDTAQIGAPPRPGGMPPLPPEIVVAFNDKSKIKPICDLYWKDKDAARAAFVEFASDKPYLAGLRLKSVNYSDNLILELPGNGLAPGSGELRALYGAATKKLRAAPDVKYAEPNSTAQPGKDDS